MKTFVTNWKWTINRVSTNTRSPLTKPEHLCYNKIKLVASVALATDTALDLYLRWVSWPCQMPPTLRSNSSVPRLGRNPLSVPWMGPKNLSVPRMGRKGLILSVVVVVLSVFCPKRTSNNNRSHPLFSPSVPRLGRRRSEGPTPGRLPWGQGSRVGAGETAAAPA